MTNASPFESITRNAAPSITAVTPSSRIAPYFAWKGILDRLVAVMLLIPGLPMMAALVLLVRLTSRGPGIYSQRRVGKDGAVYTMYKLRSMRVDAESRTGPVWSPTGSDSRVTRVGYWLRKLHLDELPQLFNVLRGEMSLMGPRPERPEFVRVLGESIPNYMDRLQVLPGITGLAQINLPPDTDLNSVRRKLILDLEYIENASFFLDLRMFLSTLFRLMGLKGELVMRMMWLERKVQLPEENDLPNTPLAAAMSKADASTTSTDARSEAVKFEAEVTPDTIAAALESPPTTPILNPPRRRQKPEDSGILAPAAN
ncbi:MAG: hypothetical protein RIS70_2834, partial [Planctomycetota bacterium]